MYNWVYISMVFILFSFLGWTMETVLVSIRTKEIVNRGFMVGTFCPIYGVGVSSMYVLLTRFNDNILLLFIMGIITTTTLEYITSWFMEIMFRARWWDYSDHKFNINGRVSLKISIYWGLLSVVIIKYILPLIINMINALFNQNTAEWLIILFSVYFLTDFSFSAYNAFGINKIIKELNYIRSEIRKNIENSNIFDVVDGVKMKADEWNNKIEKMTNDFIKDKMSENIKINLEHIYGKLQDLKESYNDKVKANNFFKVRLIKAFPKLKATGSKDKS